jgi:hypothetical protein
VAPIGKLGWYQFVINADDLLNELGTPVPAESMPAAATPGQTTQSTSKPDIGVKSDAAVNTSAYVDITDNYVATVPAGARYWVVPGTCPPEVLYEPVAGNSAVNWVNVKVQPIR